MALTFKEVAEILKIIDASACEEVVVELEGLRLVVRRGSPNSSSASASAQAQVTGLPARTPISATSSSSAAVRSQSFGRAQGEVSVAEGRIAVRAPMVGSFYRRPSPQEPPFVEADGRVKKGDPLGLIEVMKLFTTIEAPAAGIVETITVQNASPVEFDQLLFIIRPD